MHSTFKKEIVLCLSIYILNFECLFVSLVHAELAELFRDLARILFRAQLVFLPRTLIPDLETIVDADDRHIFFETSVALQLFRQEHATLTVQFCIHRTRKHKPDETARP